MNHEERMDAFLKRFIYEHIYFLREGTFKSPDDYQFRMMMMFQNWRILNEHLPNAERKLKNIAPIVKIVDDLDTDVPRPVEMKSLRSLCECKKWKEMQRLARSVHA